MCNHVISVYLTTNSLKSVNLLTTPSLSSTAFSSQLSKSGMGNVFTIAGRMNWALSLAGRKIN